jgi:hypothetical protein
VQQKDYRKFDRRTGLCHIVMILRKIFCQTGNNTSGLSARLAQTGWCDTHGHWLPQNFDQHHDPAFAIGHLVDAFNAGERRFRQTHTLVKSTQRPGTYWMPCAAHQDFSTTKEPRYGHQ